MATEAELKEHLRYCDTLFVPPLSNRVAIDAYAAKIFVNAKRFEVWVNGKLVGLLAVYCNHPVAARAFVTSVSVLPEWRCRGLASSLMARSIDAMRRLGFTVIELEVERSNMEAVALYTKYGFTEGSYRGGSKIMMALTGF
jgi:ribosomal protein S18 acetylase RimI-like enzyme